jgi:uncharacterized membrane protein
MATTAAFPRVAAPAAAPRSRTRVQSLDVLRGIVMVIMAIDHTRDFLHSQAQLFSPEDLAHTTILLFFTRWITHFCAPVFVFLAGTGAYLAARRGMSTAALSRFLWTRGLWLVIVEMTLVLFGTSFNLSYRYLIWQVIWAIGWSMLALSLLVFLPWRVLLVFSLTMIVAHNLFDGVRADQLASLGWLWKILHEGPSIIQLPAGHSIFVIYPLVPWIGVMSAGYCFGRVFDLESNERRRLLLRSGVALTATFFALRFINMYGDPSPWSGQSTASMTVLSFLRVSKYPPSLLFLLATLGPSLVALSLLERVRVGEGNPMLVFGRVPLFYYVVHWYAIHLTALGLAWMRYGRFDFLFEFPPSLLPPPTAYPDGYGYDLWVIYLVWAFIVTALYPLCRWFAGVKARNRSAWLSYL